VLSRFVGQAPGAAREAPLAPVRAQHRGCRAGSAGAGFFLLRSLGVTATILVAVAANLGVGVLALGAPRALLGGAAGPPRSGAGGRRPRPTKEDAWADGGRPSRPLGGGCLGLLRLGYEVLWTRMLTFVVGTSVYSFTIILVAFLAGIASGSAALGLVQRRRTLPAPRAAAALALSRSRSR